MIILRQKYFTEEESTGKKIGKAALAIGGTALALGAAAKGGMLGGRAQVSANNLWGNAGKALGSEKMMRNAAVGIKKGTSVQAVGAGKSMREAVKAGQSAAQEALTKWGI